MCGHDLNTAYVVMAVGEGRGKRRRAVSTPVRWCRLCRRMALAAPVGSQSEVRRADFFWSCARCSGNMRRLVVWHGFGRTVPIPLSYCLRCASVSFRPVAGKNDAGACDLCHAAVPAVRRWCGPCAGIVKKWRRLHGDVPPPGDGRLGNTMRMVELEAGRRGWRLGGGRRICMACRAAYAPSHARQKRCRACIDCGRRRRRGGGGGDSSGRSGGGSGNGTAAVAKTDAAAEAVATAAGAEAAAGA